MQTITLNLLKKNRVYFKYTNEKGYEVKLKITEKSKDLELKKHELLVNDISVRSKYGTDVIYEMEEEIKDEGIVTLTHKYNVKLVEECRNLGGKWDVDTKSWFFTKIVEDKVEELDYLYNTNIVDIEIKSLEEIFASQKSINFMGYPLAKATGRDSGAIVCDHVSLISGKISSSGSVKNWGTELTEGTIFRLKISKNLIENFKSDKWELKILL